MNTEQLMHRAADIIEREAEALRAAHTVGTEWRLVDESDKQAVMDHLDMLLVARELRKAAKGVPVVKRDRSFVHYRDSRGFIGAQRK